MKTWNNVKRWLTGGCVYYTLLSVLLILIRYLADPNNSNHSIPTSFWQILPCARCFSAAGMLLTAKALPRWGRYLSHYAICILSVVVFFFLLSSAPLKAVTVLLLTVLLTVLYWIVFGLVLLIRSRIRALLEEDQ